MNFRKNYEAQQKSQLICKEQTRTKQSFQAECDINNILKRYEKTGQLPDLIKQDPRYGDFADLPSYQEALHLVEMAQTQFAALPVQVRDRFGNDPQKFLAFAENGLNGEEMVKMGLATRREIDSANGQKTEAKAETKETK